MTTPLFDVLRWAYHADKGGHKPRYHRLFRALVQYGEVLEQGVNPMFMMAFVRMLKLLPPETAHNAVISLLKLYGRWIRFGATRVDLPPRMHPYLSSWGAE